jgi:hypothetical protein
MSQSDSDSEYNDPDQLYSDADAIDPEAYEELVTSLQPVMPVLPPITLPKPDGFPLFRSLGVNVIRLLLTYFDLTDFVRITTVNHWFYTFGTDPALLSRYGSADFVQVIGLTMRMSFLINCRHKALMRRKRRM